MRQPDGSELADARPGDWAYAMGADGLVTVGTIRALDAAGSVGDAEWDMIRNREAAGEAENYLGLQQLPNQRGGIDG